MLLQSLVVSSRAHKAVAKAESEVTKDVTSSEEPVKPVKHTRRTAKAPESKKEENTMTQADSELLLLRKQQCCTGESEIPWQKTEGFN